MIDAAEDEHEQSKMTVYDYICGAEWCMGFEPTDCKGRYLLITTHQQLPKAREWLDKHLEILFTKYIPQFQTFTPVEGYAYPKRGDKPRFSTQLGTYADQLRNLYTPMETNQETTNTKWNKSPIHKRQTNPTLTLSFATEEYPKLPKRQTKRTQSGSPKPQEPQTQPKPTPEAINSITAKTLHDQIMADIKTDMTKTISQEITTLRTGITKQLAALSTTITTDCNAQIAEVIATIQALNLRFSEVMERLPTNPNTTPAHKKSKGLGIPN